jgi:myosin-1
MSSMLAALDFQRAPTVGVEDLVMLTTISDKAIVENLKLRFARDLIYTSIGSVLISVNPFKRIQQYGPERIEYYQRHGKTTTIPHVFGLAESTYRTMILEEENQCVIISGESGAGKTEAAKQIMLYVAAVSGDSKEMARVKEIILESNPLLEAFGNAKTVRNDNSSRFGKFFEIYFNRVGGPVGGRMSNFLLEKSRVTRQQKGERNFHVFYQLCCGADDSLKTRLKLRGPGEFFFLNQGATLERAGVDDAKEWRETLQAMDKIGFSADEKNSIIELLAGILHLGEVKFVPDGDHAALGPGARDSLNFAASLLKVDPEGLLSSFLTKKLDTGGEVVIVKYDLQQAVNTRDALAKTIFDKIFNFVVFAVNRAFGKQNYALMLGVLDIYGFEIFEKNGFEQFCINYVNEKLQQIFIELTLKVEQEEYVREKIAWEEIKFFNNKVVCDLIEGRNPPGLFAIMDDVCAAMAKEKESVADVKMVDKLAGAHGQHDHFKRCDGGFLIKHYAGDVRYSTEGFTARNKDLLSNDLVAVITTTGNKFFSELLSDLDVDATSTKQGQARRKATTAGFKIREQAEALVKTLKACTPHYVRTIKSNDEKQANLIDDARVLHQCKYLGLLENIRVRRAGYAYRQYFDKFLKRFKYVSPKCFPRPFRGADKDACREILKSAEFKVPGAMWQLGETKVFIRQPQNIYALEELREKSFGQVVARIQRAWMKYRNRREWVVLKRNMDKIYVKGGKERRRHSVFRSYLGGSLNFKLMKDLHSLIEFDPIAKAWTEHFTELGKKYYYNVITTVTQWQRPPEMEEQRVLYAYKVQRVFNHNQGQKRTEYMVITDRAIYFIEKRKETIVIPPTPPTKQNPKPEPPPPPRTEVKHYLTKKLDVRLLRQLSVSKLADTYAVIHVYDAPTPYRNVYKTPEKGATNCQWSQEKFTAKDKKAHCPGCGLLVKAQFLSKVRPMPTLGFPAPVAVCENCEVGEPYEACEDVVLSTPLKTEMVAMIRRVYKQVMGSKMPVTIDNNVPYQLSGEAQPRTCVFQAADVKETMLYVAPNQLVLHCPPGIPQAEIARQQAERDAKAKAELAEHRKNLESERIKEIEKEKEREEAHKKMVEERKRQKADSELQEERDREAREEAARQQRERSKANFAAKVAQK